MGIPIPNQSSHSPRAAVVAIVVVGAVLLVLGGPTVYFLSQNWRPNTTPPIAVTSPSPSASPTPAVTPTPSPSPSPVSVLSTLHGRIAISSGQPGSGGWIQLPAGSFTADAKSNVLPPNGGWGQGLSWNAQMNTWVPATWYQVRPDGKVYAYMGWSGVWIARSDGTSSALAMLRPGMPLTIVGVEPEGVYVSPQERQGGMVLLDYAGGTRQVSATGFWQLAAFGYAYGTVTPYVPQGGTTTIKMLNLKTGKVQDWFTDPGFQATVIGIDLNAVPIIAASNETTLKIWLARPQSTGGPIVLYQHDGRADNNRPYPMSAVGDRFGVWVAMSDGLHLWSPQSGWEFVSSATGQIGSTMQ